MLDRFSDCSFTCEYKYDGERAQIHLLEGGVVKVYSRNSEDNSTKYPDIAALMPRAVRPHVTSIIIDSEAVAVDTKTGAILPFQVLSTRKRKDASVDDIGVKVCVYAFDLLYLNGESYLQRPLAERRAALHSAFEVLPREFEFAQSSDAADVEAIQEFLTESIKGNCEGLMVKTLAVDATYEPSRRSLNWLKVKKDYLAGMGDSCDLVPIGAYHGKGKRTGVYGAYLLACYNEVDEEYQSICKIGTGFSDEALKQHTEALDLHKIDAPRRYYNVPEGPSITPDVWFEPKQVITPLPSPLQVFLPPSSRCLYPSSRAPSRSGRCLPPTSRSRPCTRPRVAWSTPPRASRCASRASCVSATTRGPRTRPTRRRSRRCTTTRTSSRTRRVRRSTTTTTGERGGVLFRRVQRPDRSGGSKLLEAAEPSA